MIEVEVKNEIRVALDEGAYAPERAHTDDAGLDIRTPKRVVLRAHKSVLIDSGVCVEIAPGYAGMLKSKSGLNCKHGIISEGVIDAGYTGSIGVKLYNLSDEDYIFEAGDKITQLVIVPIVTPAVKVVETILGGDRGDAGFGSTGR